jgi:hypothetical protein
MRARHDEILSGVNAEHPDVAVVLNPQPRIQARRAAAIEQHVRSLEAFADLVKKADAARQREEAVRQLEMINDSDADLFAQQGHSGSDLETTGQISQDVEAVIEQTNEAIRWANEAGRNLVLPDEPDELTT